MIINFKKQPVVQGFQLDDTFDGHRSLYNILGRFLATHSDSALFVGMESTGGYENNWYNSLIEFQVFKPPGCPGIDFILMLKKLGTKRS